MLASTVSFLAVRFVRLCAWCLAFLHLGAFGCAPEGYRIDVDVDGYLDEVVRLSVSAKYDGQAAESTVTQSLEHFALHLVAVNSPGTLDLTVRGIAADGCQRAVAARQVMLPIAGPIAVTLTPERGCKVVIRRVGDGQGQVLGQAKMQAGALTCKFDGASAIGPLCEAEVPGSCAFCFPLDSQITLDASSDPLAVPKTYFAGWTGACAGRASCQFAISAGQTEIGAGFLPNQLCSPDRVCWQHPTPQGNPLYGLWGASADDVWMVGAASTLLHWNGSFLAPFRFTPAAGVIDLDAIILNSVWGSAPNDVWAVGTSGTILHWSGASWRQFPSGTTNALNSIWGSGSKDIWAVGQNGTILHFDGTDWSPAVSGSTASLEGVWGSGASDIWAVGLSGTILRYDGKSWSQSSSGTTAQLSTVWGSGPGDVWAVGRGATILHYDGSSWSAMSNPATDFINSVWGTGPTNVWAAANSSILHYDGTRWQTYSSWPDMDGNVYAVWGTDARDVWAIGQPVLHLSGSNWLRQDGRLTSGQLNGAWGTGAGDIWAAGSSGSILHFGGTGTIWSLVNSPVTEDLFGIWGSPPDDVWAVGTSGTIIHHKGTDWTRVPSNTTAMLLGIWGSDANNIWAVGDFGVILHYDGTSWARDMSSATTKRLWSIWGSSKDNIWAVGDFDAIVHYDGNSWVSDPKAPSLCNLRGVGGSGSNDVWAVGYLNGKGCILRSQGIASGWIVEDTSTSFPSLAPLGAVWGRAANDTWIVGGAGTILHFNGTSLLQLRSSTYNKLNGLWGSGAGDVTVVGNGGAILGHFP